MPASILELVLLENADLKAKLAEAETDNVRLDIVLRILRVFGGLRGGWNVIVVSDMLEWIGGPRRGPVPYPKSLFFDEWAKKQGFCNIDGFIGMKAMLDLEGKSK